MLHAFSMDGFHYSFELLINLFRTPEIVHCILTHLKPGDCNSTCICGFARCKEYMILPEKLWDRQEDALAIIQTMDPAGVGASDWRESLILQAKDKGLKGKELKIFSELVLDCLDNLRQGKTAAIAKQLRTDEEEILALSDFLKTLTPFPGREYSSEWDQYITPDISIKKEGEVLRLRINSDALPLVELDPEYTEMLSELKKDGDNAYGQAEGLLPLRATTSQGADDEGSGGDHRCP